VSSEAVVGAPHSSQNLARSRKPVPHDPHASAAVMRTPPIQGPRLLQLRTIRLSTPKNSAIHHHGWAAYQWITVRRTTDGLSRIV
jgi:hypothetical protein